VRHDHVQAINRTALEDGDQLLVSTGLPIRGKSGSREKRRGESETHQSERAVLEKDTS
jgi:hypothetical protein